MNKTASSFGGILNYLGTLARGWWNDDSRKREVSECMQSLWKAFLGTQPELRSELLSSIPRSYSGTFLLYARLMAVDAVIEGNPEYLLSGATSLALENGLIDARDTITMFALLWHSAQKLGQTPSEFFRPVVAEACRPFSEFLVDFVSRPQAGRDISKFGYKEGIVNGHFAYIQF